MTNPACQKWICDVLVCVEHNDLIGFQDLVPRFVHQEGEIAVLGLVVKHGRGMMLEHLLANGHGFAMRDVGGALEKGASHGQVETVSRLLEWANIHNHCIQKKPYAWAVAVGAMRSDTPELLERHWAQIKDLPSDLFNGIYSIAAQADAVNVLGFLFAKTPKGMKNHWLNAVGRACAQLKFRALSHLLKTAPHTHSTETETTAGNCLLELLRKHDLRQPQTQETVYVLLEHITIDAFGKRFKNKIHVSTLQHLEEIYTRRQRDILVDAIEHSGARLPSQRKI